MIAAIAEKKAGFSAPLQMPGRIVAKLVDDLTEQGYRNVTVLDISQTALDAAQRRLGATSSVRWLCADVTETGLLAANSYDVWHDRAVFHFLTKPEDRMAYVRNVTSAVKPGGHVIVSTFGPEGPDLPRLFHPVITEDFKTAANSFGVR